jgi:hypothetical protein
MTIGEIVRQGLYYARNCRSLWLFGFIVAIASGGSSGGGNSGGNAAGGAAAAARFSDELSVPVLVAIVLCVLLIGLAAIVIRFVSEGALIEGVVRARAGARLTLREGLRAGWAHWGVLLRIALIYGAAILVSLAVVMTPCVIAVRAVGPIGGIALGIPAVLITIPWLITLHLIQAFASRIAVLENRRAMDAIGKARLFLHGRLMHGLKLIVGTFIGTFLFVVIALLALLPVALLAFALAQTIPVPFAAGIAILIVVPLGYVLAAMTGTFRSSVWTIGYVSQVEA